MASPDPLSETSESPRSPSVPDEPGAPTFRHSVVVLHGPSLASLGERVCIDGPVELGRGSPSPIDAAEDRTLSRRHARFSIDHGVFGLRDLGSTNGTFVNGERVLPEGRAVLGPGDVVELGDYALLVDPAVSHRTRPVHPRIVGRSEATLAHLEAIEQAAKTDRNVLLYGPPGAGKSLAATELHLATLARQGRGGLVLSACDRPGEMVTVLSELVRDDGKLAGVSTLVLDALDRAPAEDLRKLPSVCGISRERGVRVVMCSRASPMSLTTDHEELAKVVSSALPIEVQGLEARREDIPWLLHHFFAPLGASAPEIPRAFVARLVRGAESEDDQPFEQSILARAMGRTVFPDNVRGLYAQLDVCVGLAAIGQELGDLKGTSDEESESMPPRRAVTVARDGTFIQVARERVHLRGRRALRALLARLVENLETTPWDSVPVKELFDKGWTANGNPLAAASKVYLAMSTLRRVGLAGHVERSAVGYRLVPSRELELMDAPPSA